MKVFFNAWRPKARVSRATQTPEVPPVKGYLPIPEHLKSQLPSVPPLFTEQELTELLEQHAKKTQNPYYLEEPSFMPSTKEQWARYYERLRVMEKRGELAMELDPEYKRKMEEWWAEEERHLKIQAEWDAKDCL